MGEGEGKRQEEEGKMGGGAVTLIVDREIDAGTRAPVGQFRAHTYLI